MQEGRKSDTLNIKEIMLEWMKMVLHFWYFGVLGCVLGAIFGYLIGNMLYTPQYTSYASVVVRQGFAGESSGEDSTTEELESVNQVELTDQLDLIAQLSKVSTITDNSALATSLSYIMNSEVMQKMIAAELNLTKLSSTISVSELAGTNLLTIKVTDANAAVAQEVLDTLLASYPKIAEYIVGVTQLTMIENSGEAIEPNNDSPVIQNIIIGICYGIGIFVIVLFCIILGRKTVHSSDDMKELKEIQDLGSIPYIHHKKKSRNATSAEPEYERESFMQANSALANQLIRDSRKIRNQVYLFTSTHAGEGKSTISLHTALILMRKKYKVLLVDADLYNSSLCRAYRGEAVKRLQHVLKGECEPKDAIIPYKNTRLHYILGNQEKNSEDQYQLLSGNKMKLLVEEWRKEYDFILIDTPPVSLLAEASLLGQLADKAVLVVRQNQVYKLDALRTIERLENSGVALLGFVMNGVKYGRTSYGYGHGNYYGYRYGKKYGYYGEYYGASGTRKKSRINRRT
ncbi:MAG: AAA family ATPase [Eubacteriales bacterium]